MSYELNLKERGIEFIELIADDCPALPADQKDSLEFFDLCYRTLCSVMFNHASSGHPGGSVSSGRIVQSLVFNRMDYDIGNPMDRTADILSYAAGHKALGLYAMSALRNEVVRLVDPDRLPEEKLRGVTIELGFAHLSLPDPEKDGLTYELGIVDVPGHERLVSALADVKDNCDSDQFIAIQKAAIAALLEPLKLTLTKLDEKTSTSNTECQWAAPEYTSISKGMTWPSGQPAATVKSNGLV